MSVRTRNSKTIAPIDLLFTQKESEMYLFDPYKSVCKVTMKQHNR